MSYDKAKGDKLKQEVVKRIGQIAVFFETTFGYPHELFYNQVNEAYDGKEFGLKILFIENFRRRYPKHCDPLPHWKDL